MRTVNMVSTGIRVGNFLRHGPGFLAVLSVPFVVSPQPSLDLTSLTFFSFFAIGIVAYFLAFIVFAMSSRSLLAALLQFFPGSPTTPFYFSRLFALAVFGSFWGVNVGLAFELVERVGANQSAEVNAIFIRYHWQPKSLCQKQAVFATSFGEVALCTDGFPSKIHPRFPVDASLVPGDLVVLAGRKNRFVFIPEKGTRLVASR